MFTGIIESTGILKEIEQDGTNLHFTIESPISAELKVDQSLAHDGVCLTVVRREGNRHTVTAIEETLIRSNLGQWKPGTLINLERAMSVNGRLDGHMVQGHVDTTAVCTELITLEGSWYFEFEYPAGADHLLVNKGSVCVNGVSLTVVEPAANRFRVAIIPYTFEHTNFQQIRPGSRVNIEFDILGKYISRYLAEVYGGRV